MISNKKIKDFFKIALNKMFCEVGFDKFDEEFVKQENWYLLHEWTEQQEKDYRQWFIKECRDSLKMSKKTAELEAGYFLLMWGWKTKYIEEEKILNHEEHKIDEDV